MKEDILVSHLKGMFKMPKGFVGIGDDTAVVPYNKKYFMLFTTDTILDGVHFESSKIPARFIGHKALAVNISDIAAMGGLPYYTVISLGIPKHDLKLIDGIYAGIKQLSSKYNIKIVGGDTVKSERIFLAVAMIGYVEKDYLIKRSGAKNKDFIFVTGKIGGSFKSGKHYKFKPRLEEARWLAKNLHPNSMIDISDGLLIDLHRICNSSKKGAILNREAVPLSKGVDFESALREGEDFELLFTLSRNSIFLNSIDNSGFKITQIGEITQKAEDIFIKCKKGF
ncbi:MAG: thiamine-phosphate kinase, partial [Candidatus Omnitrophica bacterium]|nr:thiamine-phosphate kinase [Candidatus Omnitrophota bacterium]